MRRKTLRATKLCVDKVRKKPSNTACKPVVLLPVVLLRKQNLKVMGYFPVENIDDYVVLNDDLKETVANWQNEHPELRTNSWYSVAVHSEPLKTLYQSLANEITPLYQRGLAQHGARVAYNFGVPIAEEEHTIAITRAMFLFDESYLQPWINQEIESKDTEQYQTEDAVLLLFAWEVPDVLIEQDENLQPTGSLQGGKEPIVVSVGAVLYLPYKDEAFEEGSKPGDSFLVQFPSEVALAHSAAFTAAVSVASELQMTTGE